MGPALWPLEARQYTVDGNPREPFQQMVFLHDDMVEFPDLARSVHLPSQQANILRQGNCYMSNHVQFGLFFKKSFGGFVEMNCCPSIYHKFEIANASLHLCWRWMGRDLWIGRCRCNRGLSYKILPAKCTWESLGLNSA